MGEGGKRLSLSREQIIVNCFAAKDTKALRSRTIRLRNESKLVGGLLSPGLNCLELIIYWVLGQTSTMRRCSPAERAQNEVLLEVKDPDQCSAGWRSHASVVLL